ncbi:probable G-protein coupled receptor 141 [Tachyglossus aculeatus]|uniref:probable G-protein coupled receptor 141 n=1 Tax=Tachyglossus aculeatus TaxID=9261 RepID=UPI0018F432E2|nr:probable G-protein coupled receptor 141 [Tachyglossus aculeatus]
MSCLWSGLGQGLGDDVEETQVPKEEKTTPRLSPSACRGPTGRSSDMAASNVSHNVSSCSPILAPFLTRLYLVVLIVGLAGVISILFLLVKMNTRTVTTTAVINLVVVHGLFLLTVPFHLSYLIRQHWDFSWDFCKFVSAMLHIHMYLTFIFYLAILLTRYLIFFKRKDKVEFYRKLHAVAASVALWLLILVLIIPVMFSHYGTYGKYDEKHCFSFQKELTHYPVKIVNYFIAAGVIVLACLLLACQVFITVTVMRKLPHPFLSHQEFWAQLKNLFFIGIIFVCFLPYHLFRLHYLQNESPKDKCSQLEFFNEVFLSLSALSCFDLLLFVIGGSRWFKQNIIHLRGSLSCC